jgi:hypothetical protein
MEEIDRSFVEIVQKHCPTAGIQRVTNVGHGRGIIRMSKIESDLDLMALAQDIQRVCSNASAVLTQEGSKPILTIKYNINAKSAFQTAGESVVHRRRATIHDDPGEPPASLQDTTPPPRRGFLRWDRLSLSLVFITLALWLLRELYLIYPEPTTTSGI